jgi:hypothetical protein
MNLEHELRALPLAFPPEPDLEARVLARLERPRRRWLVPALVVVAAAGALLAIPQTRAAILDFFRIGDVSVQRVGTQPRAPAREPQLGRPVSLRDAQAAVDFELVAPDRGFEAYLDESVRGGMVNLRFDGLVLSQWRGEQLPFVQKQVGPGSVTVSLLVDGAPGLWIAGALHEIVYRDGDEIIFKSRRLAGNVLIWERDGITHRLEGARTRVQALAAARDLDGG